MAARDGIWGLPFDLQTQVWKQYTVFERFPLCFNGCGPVESEPAVEHMYALQNLVKRTPDNALESSRSFNTLKT